MGEKDWGKFSLGGGTFLVFWIDKLVIVANLGFWFEALNFPRAPPFLCITFEVTTASFELQWVQIRNRACPSEWERESIRLFLLPSPSFNLLSHPWGRLGALFCHCFDTALSLLMNKWPLSMIEHRRSMEEQKREREGRKGHFQNSLHVVNILNEFALWMEDDDDDMTDATTGVIASLYSDNRPKRFHDLHWKNIAYMRGNWRFKSII